MALARNAGQISEPIRQERIPHSSQVVVATSDCMAAIDPEPVQRKDSRPPDEIVDG
jgi:hypothetical protein